MRPGGLKTHAKRHRSRSCLDNPYRRMISFMSRPIFYLRNKLSERHFIILSSILVGLASGAAAILLKYMVHHIEEIVADSRRTEDFFVFAIFPLLGILLTVFFIRYFLNNTLKK